MSVPNNIKEWLGLSNIVDHVVCAAVHSVCNGRQFHPVDSLTFAMALNLREEGAAIKVAQREKTRVCYAIWLIGKTIRADEVRRAWIEAVLKAFSISKTHYDHHYYDPVSSDSDDNQKFVRNLGKALDKAENYLRELAVAT